MLDPLSVSVKRNARGPSEEGLTALRSFAEYLGRWPDLPESARPVRAARRSIDEHSDAYAYRGLYAEALDELWQRTGLGADLAGRMDHVTKEWKAVTDRLDELYTLGPE